MTQQKSRVGRNQGEHLEWAVGAGTDSWLGLIFSIISEL